MAPLSNTTVIPRAFAANHARAIADRLESWVRLSVPGGPGERDPDTGVTPVLPPVPYYEGPGRVQSRSAQTRTDRADQRVTVGNYLVVVPVAAGVPQRGHLLDVLRSPDPALAGASGVVVDVPAADIVLQRNLGVDLMAPDGTGVT